MMKGPQNPFGRPRPMANPPKKLTKPSDLLYDPSIWIIFAVNLLPVYAVAVWHWSLFSLILVYWCETVILALLEAVKIAVYYPSQIGQFVPQVIFFYGV